MIKYIEIRNFGIHKKLILDNINRGLNVIIGKSNRGKTTILRALKVLAHNEPSGAGKLYARNKKKKFYIKVITDKDIIIRTNKEYILNGMKFKAFGKSVPEPVKEALKLKDINWQLQIQPHFLILENGGTVAKFLSNILGTKETEDIIKEIKNRSSLIKSEQKNHIKEIKEQKEIIEELKNIKEYKINIKECTELVEHLQGLEKTLNSLSKLVKKIKEIDEILIDPLQINKYLKLLGELEMEIKSNKEIESKMNHLKKIQEQLEDIRLKDINVIQQHIKHLNDIEKSQSIIYSIEQENKNLNFLNKQIKELEEELEYEKEQERKLQKLFDENLKKLKICPFCNKEI